MQKQLCLCQRISFPSLREKGFLSAFMRYKKVRIAADLKKAILQILLLLDAARPLSSRTLKTVLLAQAGTFRPSRMFLHAQPGLP